MTAWRKEQARDRFFRQAHDDGYRARSVYKLREIVDRYKVIRPGYSVIDLGAAPGSWSQAASEIVGPGGTVVAVDLSEIAPLPGVVTIVADMTSPAALDEISKALGHRADAVISDAAPSTTGVAITDQSRSIELSEAALAIAGRLLRTGGSFVAKVFRGPDFDGYVSKVKLSFTHVHISVPEATRKESREAFVVGLGFRGQASQRPD